MSIIAGNLLDDIEVNADNRFTLLKLSSEFLRTVFSFFNVTKVFEKAIVFSVDVNKNLYFLDKVYLFI
ncbi:hypothetical protein IQ264_29750 [Phormidium sp. LEGE 05292]|uniref:hypothetical protein n=1 Tax=[Phormidium] sp. LEGE 05292 TaxID=767427 RepID=UPI001880B99B|nr:hypothetical protein [Phormidium sp. LEGE 05292]MBE9229595.1 hypothetical protein [Phormidium sp. LEGE 05292]